MTLVPPASPDPVPGAYAGPRSEGETIGERDLGHWRTRLGRLLVWAALILARALAGAVGWSIGNIALVLTLVVGGTVAILLTQAAGEIYEAVVAADGIARLDQPALDFMVGMRSPGLDAAVTSFTHTGGKVGMPILAVIATLTMALWWRRWTPVVLMLAASAGSLLMTVVGKDLTGLARPPQSLAVPPFESSPSFPSGHTLNATVVAGVIAYLLLVRSGSRRARVAIAVTSALFVLAMGMSRVYLGHHWLSDVVAAWLFGLGWLAVVVTAHRLMITLGRTGPMKRTSSG